MNVNTTSKEINYTYTEHQKAVLTYQDKHGTAKSNLSFYDTHCRSSIVPKTLQPAQSDASIC